MKLSLFLTGLALAAGLVPLDATEATFSLPARPDQAVTIQPRAVIPLPGGVPARVRPGQAGEVLVFQVHPKASRPSSPPKPDEAEASAKEEEYGAAILDLKAASLVILPGTKPTKPGRGITSTLDVTANAHSVYVSDREKASVKRFRISDQTLVVEREFPYDDHAKHLSILTANAATNTPLILTHATRSRFLSADRLLEVTPRYGPQAIGSSPPLSSSSSLMADPTGSAFYRDSFLWRYDQGQLSSWNGVSVVGLQDGWLSYNGALTPTSEGLSPTTGKNRPILPIPFVPALTRPLCYHHQSVRHERYGREITVCRNQGLTQLLKIQLPDRVYPHHFISFKANRVVAFSENPPEILIYDLDLEATLESLGAAPWVEVTGPGYLSAGSSATFQMRPAFGKFKSLKLLSPLEQTETRGTKIIFRSRYDTPTSPQRISLEFTDQEGRKGTTFFDLNILGARQD
jgi:hypothetical protein